MARLPEILTAIALIDGYRSVETFDGIARLARERGLLPPSKRGKGAAHLTAGNVTDLFLASMFVAEQADAVRASDQLRTLRRLASADPVAPGAKAAIAAAETFGGALDVLIERAPELATEFLTWADQRFSDIAPERRYFARNLPTLEVAFSTGPAAWISITHPTSPPDPGDVLFSYTVDMTRPRTFYDAPGFVCGPHSDRSLIVKFSLDSFMILNAATFGAADLAKEAAA